MSQRVLERQVERQKVVRKAVWTPENPKFVATGVDGARWLLRTSNPLCMGVHGASWAPKFSRFVSERARFRAWGRTGVCGPGKSPRSAGTANGTAGYVSSPVTVLPRRVFLPSLHPWSSPCFLPAPLWFSVASPPFGSDLSGPRRVSPARRYCIGRVRLASPFP